MKPEQTHDVCVISSQMLYCDSPSSEYPSGIDNFSPSYSELIYFHQAYSECRTYVLKLADCYAF